jgi:hypothetical protein
MKTGELRYYHSSQNNSRFCDVPHLIRTEEDLEKYVDELQDQDILEYIRQQRPDTKWVVHLLTNVTLYANKLFDHPIGARVVLPDHILKNKADRLWTYVGTLHRHEPESQHRIRIPGLFMAWSSMLDYQG